MDLYFANDGVFDRNGTEKILANSLNTLFIKGKPTVING